MQKVRRKQVLQSCLERHRRVRVVLAKQPGRCHCPSLHLQGEQEPSGAQRLFPALCCRLGWARGEPARKSRAMHWSKFLSLHQLLYLACALHVLLLAVLSLFPSYDCKSQMGSWCWSRTWKTGSLFFIVTMSSRNNRHNTDCIVFCKSLLKLASIILDIFRLKCLSWPCDCKFDH